MGYSLWGRRKVGHDLAAKHIHKCIQISQEAGMVFPSQGGLVFPSLSEFSTVYYDPHSQRLWHSQ